MSFFDLPFISSCLFSSSSVPIIPTFLYAIDHPSPEPQTLGPPLLPGPSTSSLVLETVSPESGMSPPVTSSHTTSSLSPLLSLFDNTTFSTQEVQTTLGADVQPADLQTNQTTDATVGEGRLRSLTQNLLTTSTSIPSSAELLLSTRQSVPGAGERPCGFAVCLQSSRPAAHQPLCWPTNKQVTDRSR